MLFTYFFLCGPPSCAAFSSTVEDRPLLLCIPKLHRGTEYLLGDRGVKAGVVDLSVANKAACLNILRMVVGQFGEK